MAAYSRSCGRAFGAAPILAAALGATLGSAAPASATQIDPIWTNPVEPSLKDGWNAEEDARAPDLTGRLYGDTVRERPDAPLDLQNVVHPTHAEAPPVPARASEALDTDLTQGLTADPTEPDAARLDRKTGGVPLPWEAPSRSVFADVLRNVPERVAKASEYGLRDALVTGLAASAAALPPPPPVDTRAVAEARRAAATSEALASAVEASPTGASPNDRGPIAILLLIVLLMSTVIFVVAKPASRQPQLLRSRRFGH